MISCAKSSSVVHFFCCPELNHKLYSNSRGVLLAWRSITILLGTFVWGGSTSADTVPLSAVWIIPSVGGAGRTTTMPIGAGTFSSGVWRSGWKFSSSSRAWRSGRMAVPGITVLTGPEMSFGKKLRSSTGAGRRGALLAVVRHHLRWPDNKQQQQQKKWRMKRCWER